MYGSGILNDSFEGTVKYKLDLVGVQGVKWEGGCTEPDGDYTFSYEKGDDNHELGTGFCAQQNHISS
jgi:hypothetical protein